MSMCLSGEKRDITRRSQHVQTFQSLLHINSSIWEQQKNCTEKASSYGLGRYIVSVSSFQSFINCEEFNTVPLYLE